MDAEKEAVSFRENIEKLRKEIASVIVGHEDVINQLIIAVLAGGHALLEGVPGIGKTLLVKTISQCLNLKFSRIQFTPDLMPADIIGTNIVVEDSEGRKHFQFQAGPVFANIILADEINRATPKTQSALLECMQEKSVTVSGNKYTLEEPFFVLSTQNPIEMEGTYPLPEAQVDRFFFKIELKPPQKQEIVEIIDRTTGTKTVTPRPVLEGKDVLSMRNFAKEVPVASHVKDYVGRLVQATHGDNEYTVQAVKKYIRYGSSPRGAQSLILAAKILALGRGRYNVSFQDIRDVAAASLRHRLILNFEAEAEGIKPDQLVSRLLEQVPEVPNLK